MCGSEVRRDPNLGTVITDLRDIWATAADVQASKRVRRPTTLPPSPLVALQTLTRTRSLSLCTRPPSPPAAYILHLLGTHLLVCTLALYLRTQADQRHLGEAKGRCAAETRRETGRVCVCVCVAGAGARVGGEWWWWKWWRLLTGHIHLPCNLPLT